MQRHNTPRSNFSPQIQNNFDDNNDSLLDESNSFDLKNQIFELSSKCNNLEYEKNKILMSYQNVLKEQKQKYAILERVCSQKQEREEKLSIMLTESRSKCAYLADQNEALKKQLHSVFEKNRITPNFNSIELEKEMNVLGDLLEKEERMQKLGKQIQDAKESEYTDLRNRLSSLQKENKRLREQNMSMQAEKNQTIQKITQEAEEYHKGLIKFKDATIQQLKNEQISLTLQLEQANAHRNSQRGQGAAQNRRKEQRLVELEQRFGTSQRQRMRFQSQNKDLREDNKRLQNEKKLLERAKKSLQEEIYQLSNQISQVRAAAFNDKIESKKQLNSIKLEMEEEKTKLRSIIQEKAQENKRLREGVLTLNDQCQQLRDKQANHSKQISKLMEQNKILATQNQKYLRQGNKWQPFGGQSMKKTDQLSGQQKILYLEDQLAQSRSQLAFIQSQLKEANSQLDKRTEQLRVNEQLIQIMKIDQKQFQDRIKQTAKKLKESEQSKTQKEKVITNLEVQIKSLKDDNRQLELANQEIRDRLQTMKTINSDIENIKKQLELQKKYYEEMRHEEEQLRNKHKQSELFKTRQDYTKQKIQQQAHQYEQSLKASLEHSRERDAEISKEMEILKTQIIDLQVRLNDAQNEIDKKGIDINMKQQENIKLKALLSSPRELNFEPIIQTSKKSQFNAVFLQNKILLLQKEILGLKNLKEKEFEEYKKVYRKKVDDKYLAEFKKSNVYIAELEKNIELLNNKLNYQTQANKQLSNKVQQLTKENYMAKCDYSEALEELNSLLQKFRHVEGQLKELEFDRAQIQKISEENARLKSYLNKLSKNTEEKSLRLNNANDQIQKLNQTLMVKQSEIKMLKVNSPNSSFIASHRGEQRSVLLNMPGKEEMEMEPSSDNDSLRSWVKKCPNFSRV